MEVITRIRFDPDTLNYARPGQVSGVPVILYVSPYDLPNWGEVVTGHPFGEIVMVFEYFGSRALPQKLVKFGDISIVLDTHYQRIGSIAISKTLVLSGNGQSAIQEAIDNLSGNFPESQRLGNFAVVKKAVQFLYPHVANIAFNPRTEKRPS